jgi:hypothetical protein
MARVHGGSCRRVGLNVKSGAQRAGKVYRLGYLLCSKTAWRSPAIAAIVRGMCDLGHVEGLVVWSNRKVG